MIYADRIHLFFQQILRLRLAFYLYDRYVSEDSSRFVELVQSDLDQFSQDVTKDKVLLFPPVNNFLRLLIHKTVEQYTSLHSFSVGVGDQRRTVVCLKSAVKSQPEPGSSWYKSDYSKKRVDMSGRGRARPRGDRDSPGHSPVGRDEAGDGTASHVERTHRPDRGKNRRPDVQVYIPRGRRLNSKIDSNPSTQRPGDDTQTPSETIKPSGLGRCAKPATEVYVPRHRRNQANTQDSYSPDREVLNDNLDLQRNDAYKDADGENLSNVSEHISKKIRTVTGKLTESDTTKTRLKEEQDLANKVDEKMSDDSHCDSPSKKQKNTRSLKDTCNAQKPAGLVPNSQEFWFFKDDHFIPQESAIAGNIDSDNTEALVVSCDNSSVQYITKTSNPDFPSDTDMDVRLQAIPQSDTTLQESGLVDMDVSNVSNAPLSPVLGVPINKPIDNDTDYPPLFDISHVLLPTAIECKVKNKSFENKASGKGIHVVVPEQRASEESAKCDDKSSEIKTEYIPDTYNAAALQSEVHHRDLDGNLNLNYTAQSNSEVKIEECVTTDVSTSDSANNAIHEQESQQLSAIEDVVDTSSGTGGLQEREPSRSLGGSPPCGHIDTQPCNDVVTSEDCNTSDSNVVICNSRLQTDSAEVMDSATVNSQSAQSYSDNPGKLYKTEQVTEQPKMKSDSNKTITGSPSDPNKTITGSPSDPNKTITGSPSDPNKTITGSPSDPNKTITGSPSDPNKTITGSPSDPNKTITGAHSDPNKTITGAPSDPNKTITGAPSDPNKTITGAPSDPNKTITGAPSDPNKTITGAPSDVDGLKADIDSNMDEDEEDSWDTMFNEDGECLDSTAMEELTKTVGKVKIQKPKINYLEFQPRDKLDINYQAYEHIIEIYNFPSEFVTRDLITAFQSFMSRGFDLKWVDDTHALGIFSSAIAAHDALAMIHPLVKVRPLSEASRESKLKAKNCTEFLQPYKARPETTASAARRLVAGALGLASKVPREQRDKERQLLREAKAKRKQDRKNKEEIWEGTYGKCAMDEEGS